MTWPLEQPILAHGWCSAWFGKAVIVTHPDTRHWDVPDDMHNLVQGLLKCWNSCLASLWHTLWHKMWHSWNQHHSSETWYCYCTLHWQECLESIHWWTHTVIWVPNFQPPLQSPLANTRMGPSICTWGDPVCWSGDIDRVYRYGPALS